MCERSPLFLSEAKSILSDLLKRTLELFDLSIHLIEHDRLYKYLSERDQKHDYHQYSLHKPCQLNYNILSDLDKYLHHLFTSCRLTKSHLRSLYAARLTSSNDYIVIDDEISELIKFFKLKINKFYHQFQILNNKNNSFNEIFILFRKISQLYQILIKHLYGIHIVQDSDILQPIVINIIRLLLLITNKLKENFLSIKINRIQQNKEISTKSKLKLIENDNHSLDFDEDEFYRLANLERE